jgi:ABC-type polysaccharide/polyol phosphate transport system ATPase subunit
VSGAAAARPVAVEVDGVSLSYRLMRDRAGSIKEFAIRAATGRRLRVDSLEALHGVSLDVRRGEVCGIIGRNGAGKTTLLKLCARVLPPTTGRVVVRGRVAPMIELGAGFNPELTGRENIVLYGTMLGCAPQSMRRRAAEIAEWAGVEEFIDVPLRSYSSGMVARLAFAVATEVEPDVLLIDEVLAVGDEQFRDRSAQRVTEMIGRGAAVLLVSHDLNTIRRIASSAVWLDRGTVLRRGHPAAVVDDYLAAVREEQGREARHG